MPIAKFNGKVCAVCGREFVAGHTEIEKHPTMRGPRGGAQWVHSNPGECGARSNPRYMNAGRRRGKPVFDAESGTWKAGPQKLDKSGKPRKGQMAKAAMFQSDRPLMTYVGSTTDDLVEYAAAGDQNAVAELTRRERDPATGNKLAWGGKTKSYKERKTKSNPFGFSF
jgi:hypothetical protein